MLESRGIEISREPRVQHRQNVAVELRGHPSRIVVGGFEARRVLDQIQPHEKPVVGHHRAAHVRQEAVQFVVREVADGARQQNEQPRRTGADRAEVTGEVTLHTPHQHLGVVRRQPSGRLTQKHRVDIQQNAGCEQAAKADGVQQEVDLAPGSRSQLHQFVGFSPGDDLVRQPLQHRQFGPGLVVLRQPSDVLEQFAATIVVEVLRIDRGQRTLQTTPHGAGFVFPGFDGIAMQFDLDSSGCHGTGL
jgi:hypothetical protein